jgi:adenosine deaminase
MDDRQPAIDRIGRIELHCHLDGSVRIPTIESIAASLDLSYDRPIAELAAAPAGCTSLAELLTALDVELDVLQHAWALERAARELVADWQADGVVHGEVRFAPQLHRRRGLKLGEVLDAVGRGLSRGSASTGISTALIICVLRHQDPEVGVELAELATGRRDLVAGLDLAGPEAGYPARAHREAFEIAGRAGLPITIHAGEADGPASIWQALELGATRIGHGVRCVADPRLVQHLADTAVTLECAPTCNVVTRAVPSLPDHPIDALHRAGVAVTINTDARTPFATTLSRECATVTGTFGWGHGEHLAVQRNAAAAAFVSPERRRQLLGRLDGREQP